MSSNDSLRETNGATDSSLASEYALRVALQTIKERCVSLHQRLAIVEEENLAIKSRLSSESSLDDSQNRGYKSGTLSETEMLRDRLTKVSKEKLQLSEHIAMVTTENRQLWSRLSQLIKDQNNKQKKTEEGGDSPGSPGNAQKLIRSETFTQHSPNVLLRPKPIVPNASGAIGDADDASMEDVSLKNFGGYIDEKFNKTMTISGPKTTTLNFGYLNDDAARLGDFTQDLNGCSAGMQEMKLELKKQQNKMKVLIELLKDRRANPECLECRKRKEKPQTADKGSETEECLNAEKQRSSSFSKPDRQEQDSYDGSAHLNILEQKRLADERDKMCPLCGKIFSSAVPFDDFRVHVETHFIDDVDLDPASVENNFEFISHTVGNF